MTREEHEDIRNQLIEGHQPLRSQAYALLNEIERLRARMDAAGDIISENGCNCACGCDIEGHTSEDCEPCLACRIDKALWPEHWPVMV
jgi:hypothetical protein